ncbi:GSCFA domain-containing protein [Streptomyces sp. NBC_01476]|uniref:GSCFA domain-containing protein n=1 Tax=Streptomyces sp. NBC_01476 TaxID=2903881 RepID=UPI002E306A3A|nr:GSCFA domain-containing protein [Streptomyces sp. NBC_01476]
MTTGNPYRSLPARSFWRPAVAEPGMLGIDEVWTPAFPLGPDDPVLTAGSCFAARLGPALLAAGLNWYDAEPPPPGLDREEQQARHYGEFSFRTGTVYTAAMLRQWLSWAAGRTRPPDTAWPQDGRVYDPFRPSVEPAGHASVAEMLAARETTLEAIRRGLTAASCLVFTLGLTEAWRDRSDGSVYASCPGTVRGTFDPRRHAFSNATVGEVHRDLAAAVALARVINPDLRLLLTVSPVPLTATATGGHALVANTLSKSVLRTAAGELVNGTEGTDYFPSYELISCAPFRGVFYGPNLRSVTPDGVAFVMRHFMAGLARAGHPGDRPRPEAPTGDAVGDAAGTLPHRTLSGGDICDDAVLDYYGPR